MQLVRFKKGKKKFEILTKDGSVRLFRSGKVGIDRVADSDIIFTNYSKGNVANNNDLMEVFGTTDMNTIIEVIVTKGDLQVSASERKEDMARHRGGVLNYIYKHYLDPRTNLPHPHSRLQGLMDECKIRMDLNESFQSQGEAIVKNMQGVMGFKKASTECTLNISHKYASKCKNIVTAVGKIRKEIWGADGCVWEIDLPPNDVDMFMVELNKVTEGDYQITFGANAPTASSVVVPVVSTHKKKKTRR